MVGRDVSIRGEGISMKTALERINYKSIRKKISVDDLIPLIEKTPSLIEDWIMFSEDKRTNGGYGLNREKTESLSTKEQFKMTANYILKELDYWSEI